MSEDQELTKMLESIKSQLGNDQLEAKDALMVTAIIMLGVGMSAIRDELREVRIELKNNRTSGNRGFY